MKISSFNKAILIILFAAAYCILSLSCAEKKEDFVTLKHGHAHNDYKHQHPLIDALHNGFTSIEADIYLIDNQLLVAHELNEIDSSRTLQRLYLDPLKKLVAENKGHVYKTDSLATYKALDMVLRNYKGILTSFDTNGEYAGPVTVIISGERPGEYMRNQKLRYAGYDGRFSDLASSDLPSFMPLISDSWDSYFSWQGKRPMPANEWKRIKSAVDSAHAKGRILRLWGVPDNPGPARDNIWSKLLAAGVDLISTDDLPGLRKYFLSRF